MLLDNPTTQDIPSELLSRIRSKQRSESIYDRERYIGYTPEDQHWYSRRSSAWEWGCGYDDELVACVETDGRVVPMYN